MEPQDYRDLREKCGLSRFEAAKIVGYSPSYIQKIEDGLWPTGPLSVHRRGLYRERLERYAKSKGIEVGRGE